MPLNSPFTAPDLPQTDLLTFLLDAPATSYSPSRVVFQDDESEENLTFDDLRRRVRRLGNGLKTAAKVKTGDRVMVLATHGLHYPIALFGIMCAGATVVPVNPALSADDVAKYITLTGSETLIVGHQFLDVAMALKRDWPRLKIIEIPVVRKPQADNLNFYELLQCEEMDWPRGEEVANSTALVCFSSGTSGLPKGCQITHRNIVCNTHMHYYATKSSRIKKDKQLQDIGLGAFPPFHVAGIWGSMVNPLYCGNYQVIMKSFALPAYLDLINKYRPTDLSMAPPIVLLLATVPMVDRVDFSSVKRIGVGAAPLSQELIEKCLSRLHKLGGRDIKMLQVWGMTEGVCCLTAYDEEDEESIRLGGVGFPLPFLSLRLVRVKMETDPESEEGRKQGGGVGEEEEEEEEEEVGVNEPGEILVKGPCVFTGYLGLDSTPFFTKDGYYRTGDVGTIDAVGRLRIVDRIKELIKVSGFQVAPAELEGLLLTHPDIDDVAIIGVPQVTKDGTKTGSERVRAYLTLRPSSPLALLRPSPGSQERAIQAWVDARVVKYKRLTGGIVLLDPTRGQVVPKSPAGKILRRVLRDQVLRESNLAKL